MGQGQGLRLRTVVAIGSPRPSAGDEAPSPLHKIAEKVLYAPDMDHLEDSFVDVMTSVDMAIIDGTFYYRDEIPGAMDRVPHPPVEESIVRLRRVLEDGTRVAFTHLNHTNPLCDPRSYEFEQVVSQGFGVLLDGYAVDI